MAEDKMLTNTEGGFECSLCKTRFSFRTNLNRHKRNIHKRDTTRERAPCLYPGCDAKFYHQTKLLCHLEMAHGQSVDKTNLVFSSADQFLAWKLQEEKEKCVVFTKQRGDMDHISVVHQQYICQRDGSARIHASKDHTEARKTDRRSVNGMTKTNMVCPARMLVRKCKKTGAVDVSYFRSHSHSTSIADAAHHPLPECIRKEIRDKLKWGVSIEQIHKEYQCKASQSQDVRLSRINKKQIRAIQRRMEKKEKLSSPNDLMIPNDPEPQPVVGEALDTMDSSDNSADSIVIGSNSVMSCHQPTVVLDGSSVGFSPQIAYPQTLASSGGLSEDYAGTLQRMLQEMIVLMERDTVRKAMLPYVTAKMEQMLSICKKEANSVDVTCGAGT